MILSTGVDSKKKNDNKRTESVEKTYIETIMEISRERERERSQVKDKTPTHKNKLVEQNDETLSELSITCDNL